MAKYAGLFSYSRVLTFETVVSCVGAIPQSWSLLGQSAGVSAIFSPSPLVIGNSVVILGGAVMMVGCALWMRRQFASLGR